MGLSEIMVSQRLSTDIQKDYSMLKVHSVFMRMVDLYQSYRLWGYLTAYCVVVGYGKQCCGVSRARSRLVCECIAYWLSSKRCYAHQGIGV